jgi:hypothetical protein
MNFSLINCQKDNCYSLRAHMLYKNTKTTRQSDTSFNFYWKTMSTKLSVLPVCVCPQVTKKVSRVFIWDYQEILWSKIFVRHVLGTGQAPHLVDFMC